MFFFKFIILGILFFILFLFSFLEKKKIEKFKSLQFTHFQKEAKIHTIKRLTIHNSYLNLKIANIPILDIAKFIDKTYHEYNSILECSDIEKNYLYTMIKQYFTKHKIIKYEQSLTNQGLVKYFNLNVKTNKELINYLYNYVSIIYLYLKNYHNRVRPEFCFKNLRSSHSKKNIFLPNHASYPSGHATDSYFIHYFTNKNYALADSISKNREIAGVHYPSDTKYGKFIAYVLVYIIKNKNFPKEENLYDFL